MELEEGMVRKIAISTGAVAIFVALIVGIGTTYNDGGLGSTGGLALVASIAVFILVMAVVGFLLSD
jgi:peptidoglycan/LPS O-acetylase OafA/YrhL